MKGFLSHPVFVGCLVAGVFVVDVVVRTEPTEARRGFSAAFSAGRAAGSAAGRASRSAGEVARIKQVEGRIDWGDAGKKGLDYVKTAIDLGSKVSGGGSSSSGSATAFAGTSLDVIELEACVRESKWLDDGSDKLDTKQAGLKDAQEQIRVLGDEIDAARSRVNRSSQRSVDAFNARIEEHRRKVTQYNTVSLAEVRREQEAFNERVTQFNRYCNGKGYYASDLAEVEQKVGFKLTN